MKYQLTANYQSYFKSIAENLQLDVNAAHNRAKLVDILARSYFETYGRSREEREDLETQYVSRTCKSSSHTVGTICE